MCTAVILRRPGHPWPVIIATNRDEMKDRPWLPPGRYWPEHPHVRAGLDQEAGGTWLGLNDHGVVAAVLNRLGSLGPKPGKRSRGDLVLTALDQPTANSAVEAIEALDIAHYRSFNLIIADQDQAYWLKHTDSPDHRLVETSSIEPGVSIVTARDINDHSSPRIATYLPRFRAAKPPNPDLDDWAAWRALMASHDRKSSDQPTAAMTIETDKGFGTTSSSIIALPGPTLSESGERRPIWLFAPGRPDHHLYQRIEISE